MGFRGGGVKLTPPQRILVFKYPSGDRVNNNKSCINQTLKNSTNKQNLIVKITLGICLIVQSWFMNLLTALEWIHLGLKVLSTRLKFTGKAGFSSYEQWEPKNSGTRRRLLWLNSWQWTWKFFRCKQTFYT